MITVLDPVFIGPAFRLASSERMTAKKAAITSG
jgi:hypothetical protein